MKQTLYALLFIATQLFAQQTDYYQSILFLSGDELESELHNIIKNHTEFSYSTSKQILKSSDQDPNNNANIMLVYKGESIPKSDFASNLEPDFWSREHVWAKSHGGFLDYGDMGANSDVHNLKPCDVTVNSARGYKDFDAGGTQHSEATDCYYTATTWEPRDEVKGDIARIIFYMHTRYGGDVGEPNLNVVDYAPTYPNAQMGVLSTLLEWNEQDPVDAFERRRNDIIYSWQNNRNPFIDYPHLANLIWADASLNNIQFVDVNLTSENPSEDEVQGINAEIVTTISSAVTSATLSWGTSWYDLSNEIEMTALDDIWSANIPVQNAGTDVKYKITAHAGSFQNTFYGNYEVMLNPFEGVLTPIMDIQGNVDDSPFNGQSVSTSGVVTAVFGNSFYMQDGNQPRSGLYIYAASEFPSIGDSVIVSGEVSEYYNLTEIAFPENIYIISSNNPIPEPISINTGDLPNEDYEGMLVRVNDVTVTYATFNFDDYGNWRVDDGTGECIVHNTEDGYEYPAVLAEQIESITGICTYTYEEWKIELRIEDDVEGAADQSGPIITDVSVLTENSIAVYFNEDVEQVSAENIENYTIDNGAIIIEATRHPFQNARVTLTMEEPLSGNYTLIASNIEDLIGNTTEMTSWNFELIDVDEFQANKLFIYPNPTTNVLFIEGVAKDEHIRITSHLGAIVFEQLISESSVKLNLNLNKGIYFLHFQEFTYKFIVT